MRLVEPKEPLGSSSCFATLDCTFSLLPPEDGNEEEVVGNLCDRLGPGEGMTAMSMARPVRYINCGFSTLKSLAFIDILGGENEECCCHQLETRSSGPSCFSADLQQVSVALPLQEARGAAKRRADRTSGEKTVADAAFDPVRIATLRVQEVAGQPKDTGKMTSRKVVILLAVFRLFGLDWC